MASKSEDVFDPFDSSSHSQSALSTHYNPAGNCQSGAILQPGSASFQSSQIQDPNVSPQRTHFSQSDRVSLKSNQITELPDVDADFLDDQLNDIEVSVFIISRQALAREGDYEMMPVCACVCACVS